MTPEGKKEQTFGTASIPSVPFDCFHIPSPDGEAQEWTLTGFSLTSTLDLQKLESPIYAGYPPRAIALWQLPGCESDSGIPIAVIRLWDETGTQTLESFAPIQYGNAEHYVLGISEIGARSFQEISEGSPLWDKLVVGEGMVEGDVFEIYTIFGENIYGDLHEAMVKAPVGSDNLY
ncbi:hypothetical protein TWF481_005263 [Arthrobotrys musiformis]|uniref:Uncharacterized protein n=1 Tax=Arthrobotrys musiformis TaxID=47236 RepID=A0AAV9WIX1_9PEZI